MHVNQALARVGLQIHRLRPRTEPAWPADYDTEAIEIIKRVQPYTMTSAEKIFGLISAVRYLHRNGVLGDVVECGVWRGGSSMAAALTLLACGDTGRDLYLYDTFEGMPPPSEQDRRLADGVHAADLLRGERNTEDHVWAFAPLDGVRDALVSTGYPPERLKLVQGKVEDTIPGVVPERIALLRLDTDWYESTKHELIHLYPRVPTGGVLVLDDYGCWVGAKQAVDEWVEESRPRILLSRLDEGRIGVVQQQP